MEEEVVTDEEGGAGHMLRTLLEHTVYVCVCVYLTGIWFP